MDSATIMRIDEQCHMPVFGRLPIVLDKGSGSYVWDKNGRRYLDFLSGIAVNALGHAHPKLIEAITRQASQMLHCSNIFYNEPQALLAQKLSEYTKGGLVFFGNSGAEANEAAIKLVRKYHHANESGKYEIVTALHSFHGRTMATLSATGQPKYQEGFAPLIPGFKHVPFNDVEELKQAVTTKTAAIMIELIQGEGGVHEVTPEYLTAVQDLCDKYGALLVVDEIQTGIGRTGKMFAYEHYGIMPHIVTLAKGLGGGVPIGAVIANKDVATAFKPGDHGSTFGGNPLATSAALAVLKVLEEENVLASVTAIGQYLREQLEELQQRYPQLIKEVRGKGLLLGMELSMPGKEIVANCLARGVIINCTAGNVLRFAPPLIITQEHVDALIFILNKVLAESC